VAPTRLARIDRVCLSRFAVLPSLFSLLDLWRLSPADVCFKDDAVMAASRAVLVERPSTRTLGRPCHKGTPWLSRRVACCCLQCVTERTFNVLPIVEGVYDMGNLAAVTRSADGGIQPVLRFRPLGWAAASATECCAARSYEVLQGSNLRITSGVHCFRIVTGHTGAVQLWDWARCTSSTAGVTMRMANNLQPIWCARATPRPCLDEFVTLTSHDRSGAKYKQSARHSAGAEKWLDVRMWSSAADCLASAKAAGFQVKTPSTSVSNH